MEKAKSAVSDFLGKAGHHDTTVHEQVAPSVEHKTVAPQEREELQTATEREIHQDHYHTTVQPVMDREVLPEQHHHNLKPVEHRTHDHRNHKETERHLKQDAAKFKDEHVRISSHHTSAAAPSVAGEHVHHHIHETIQPVIEKETIEPHVVHTTVPVHEVHHNAPQHHTASALPAVSMDEFKKLGGTTSGREERVDHFSGEPKNFEHNLGTRMAGSRASIVGHPVPISQNTSSTPGTSKGRGVGLGSCMSTSANTVDPTFGVNKSAGAGRSNSTGGTSDSANTTRKPSLKDRMDPRKDADGDGKKGFMD